MSSMTVNPQTPKALQHVRQPQMRLGAPVLVPSAYPRPVQPMFRSANGMPPVATRLTKTHYGAVAQSIHRGGVATYAAPYLRTISLRPVPTKTLVPKMQPTVVKHATNVVPSQSMPTTRRASKTRTATSDSAKAFRQRKSVPVTVEVVPDSRTYRPPFCPNSVPTLASIEHLSPHEVYEELKHGTGLLVDLRSYDRVSGLIDGAVHVPAIGQDNLLSRLPSLIQEWAHLPLIIFTCQYSAHRAPQCANWYVQKSNPKQRVAILDGGFRGWEACGLPVALAGRAEQASEADKVAIQLGEAMVKRGMAAYANPQDSSGS